TIPADTHTTDTVCLQTLGNCAAGGGSFIVNGTSNQTSANFNVTGVASSVTAVIQGATGGGDITDFKVNGGGVVASIGSAGLLTSVGVTAGSGLIQGTGGLTITGGASISGGLNNNTGGITNAGAIGGATTLTLTGAISGGTSFTGSGNINTTAGAFQLNGTDINSPSTLTHVAYLTAGSQSFTGTNTFTGAGTALSVTNNAAIQGSGGLTLGSTANVGITNFLDGTADGFVTSIANTVQANNVAITIPADTHTTDTVCLQTLGNCAAGGGSFIVNGTSNQTSANFNVTGVASSVTAVIQGATGG